MIVVVSQKRDSDAFKKRVINAKLEYVEIDSAGLIGSIEHLITMFNNDKDTLVFVDKSHEPTISDIIQYRALPRTNGIAICKSLTKYSRSGGIILPETSCLLNNSSSVLIDAKIFVINMDEFKLQVKSRSSYMSESNLGWLIANHAEKPKLDINSLMHDRTSFCDCEQLITIDSAKNIAYAHGYLNFTYAMYQHKCTPEETYLLFKAHDETRTQLSREFDFDYRHMPYMSLADACAFHDTCLSSYLTGVTTSYRRLKQ